MSVPDLRYSPLLKSRGATRHVQACTAWHTALEAYHTCLTGLTNSQATAAYLRTRSSSVPTPAAAHLCVIPDARGTGNSPTGHSPTGPVRISRGSQASTRSPALRWHRPPPAASRWPPAFLIPPSCGSFRSSTASRACHTGAGSACSAQHRGWGSTGSRAGSRSFPAAAAQPGHQSRPRRSSSACRFASRCACRCRGGGRGPGSSQARVHAGG